MDSTLQAIVTLITLVVGVAGIALNYVKRTDDKSHAMHVDLVSDYDRVRVERDALLAEKEKLEGERDQLKEAVMLRDQALARIAMKRLDDEATLPPAPKENA